MKKIYIFLSLLIICVSSLFAQAPEKFTYQAVVRNANNSLVANAQVGVRVNILQGTATGNAVYSESHVTNTNANGLVTVNIGGGSVLHGSFVGIDWAEGPYFLKTDIDPNGGNDYTITSVQQLLSVPYALYAKEAGNGFSGDYNDLTNLPQIPTVPTNVSAFTNDAGYITMDSIPAIPSVPTNVSAFTNDAGYLTGYTETDPQFNAWDKNYNDLTNKPTLFSGNYNDLTNKPTLFDGNYNSLSNKPNLSAVALSGSYNDLLNKPSIPTDVGELTNNVGYITAAQVPAQVNADWNATSGAEQILNKPTLFSGNYNDLTNKPTIPIVPTNVSAFSNDAGYLTSYTETDPQFNAWDKNYNDLTNKPTLFSGNYNDLTNKPTLFDGNYNSLINKPNLATVATTGNYNDLVNKPTLFSGNYNDLTNKPTIPTVNNATLTIQRNGSNVGTFTANQNTNQTVNITVPTTTSQLTNNSGYITISDVPVQVNADWNATNGAAQILNKPNIPTNVSQLNNDAGYITAAQCGDVDICAMANQLAQLQQQMSQMQARLDSLEGNTFTCGTSTVTDHEGNVYATVQIGDQCWMRDNLRTTTSPSTGTYLIPATSANSTYTGKQARWYNNDSTTYAPMNYGLLYNWNAAMDTFNTVYGETSVNTSYSNAVSVTFSGHRRGICPAGWHLPSDAEWTQLTNYVSSQSEYTCDSNNNYIAKALASTEGWNTYTNNCVVGNDPSTNNVTGFSAVPAGNCYGSSFSSAGSNADFWSSAQYGGYSAYNRDLTYGYASVRRNGYSKRGGFSVRCLRDSDGGGESSATLPTVTTNTISNITPTTATCGGNIIADGGASVTARGVCWSTSQNPTVNGSHTADGSGMGSFSSSISGLTANTTYYVRAYATNSVGTAYGNEVSFTTLSAAVIDSKSCPAAPTATDHEGNVYATVQIGNQCWMRDNLRTTTSPSTGTYLIPAAYANYTYTGKQARWYQNDSTTYAPMNYGLLYNWNAAVDTFNTTYGETSVNTSSSNAVFVTFIGPRRGICPAGWHLPSDAEWTQLTNYVSSQSEYTCDSNSNYIAKALASTEGWNTYTGNCAVGNDSGANNATGFSAVPAGGCGGSSFNTAGYYADFWSSTQLNSVVAYYRYLYYYDAYVSRNPNYGKDNGRSVRCLRDSGGGGGSESSAVIDSKSCPTAPTVTDHEGNVYATVQIGNQCWTRDNLRTTTSPSTGTYLIPVSSTGYTYTGKQAFWYTNDSATYAPMNYGLLYNWNAAVDTFNTAYGETSVNSNSSNVVSVTFTGHRRGICPAGWHLPSDAEWTTLTDYVSSQSEFQCGGNSSYIAKALASTEGWGTNTNNCTVGNDPSTNNATGFSAVPAGICVGSSFDYAGYDAGFWSSTQDHSYSYGAYSRGLNYGFADVYGGNGAKGHGYSVRCLRD